MTIDDEIPFGPDGRPHPRTRAEALAVIGQIRAAQAAGAIPDGTPVWFRGYRYRVATATAPGGLIFYHLLADDPAAPDVRGPVPAAQVSPVAAGAS